MIIDIIQKKMHCGLFGNASFFCILYFLFIGLRGRNGGIPAIRITHRN